MPHGKKQKIPQRQKTGEFKEERNRTTSVYAEFSRWTKRATPPWHPVKKLRYIFFRMIDGLTITDALREIRWSPAEFWYLLDIKRIKKHDVFHAEYLRAKQLQGRALGDAVILIAEGRDAATRAHRKHTDQLIAKAMRRIARSKSVVKSRRLFSYLMADLREHDKIVMTRNKLQIDSTKWLAAKANPSEFGESSRMSLSGAATPNADGEQQAPLLIQFVGPDGKVSPL